jgi:endo-1,4-beta-xylanase
MRRSITLALFALFFIACKKNNNPPAQPAGIGLKDINRTIKIGAHLENDFANPKYASLVATEFNCGQSLWYAGYGGWNAAGTYDFNNLNTLINWMKERGISTHVHMLVGPDQYMPDWLKNGSFTNTELDALLKNMVDSIMESNDNKNKVDIWNVANELINDDGTYRKDMVWNQLGTEVDKSGLSGDEKINTAHPLFIRKVFEYCRQKTTKKLEYRDYNIENNNSNYGLDKKHKGVYQLLKHMLAAGIPIDGVGIQSHYELGNTNWVLQNNELGKNITKFKALGLEVYITEMDIGASKGTWDTTKAQQQKLDYYNVVKQAIQGGISRVYTWGLQDGRDIYWRTNEHPLPWDENLNKKPAYDGIKNALTETR